MNNNNNTSTNSSCTTTTAQQQQHQQGGEVVRQHRGQQEQQRQQHQQQQRQHVVVIVLGDLGRSPRMQYHVQSLLEAGGGGGGGSPDDDDTTVVGYDVTFVGYKGEPLIPSLMKYIVPSSSSSKKQQQLPQLRVIRFAAPAFRFLKETTTTNQHHNTSSSTISTTTTTTTKVSMIHTVTLFLYYLWRTISLTVLVSYALFIQVGQHCISTSSSSSSTEDEESEQQQQQQQPKLVHRKLQPPSCILVQNPPAVPLLGVVLFYCHVWRRKGTCSFVVDWHNLGYSMIRRSIVESSSSSSSAASTSNSTTSTISTNSFSFYELVAKIYEQSLASYADGHLSVTKTLRDFVLTTMIMHPKDVVDAVGSYGNDDNARAAAAAVLDRVAEAYNFNVLHDCPPTQFRIHTIQEQHELWNRINDQIIKDCPVSWKKELLHINNNNNNNNNSETEGKMVVIKTLMTEAHKKQPTTIVDDDVGNNSKPHRRSRMKKKKNDDNNMIVMPRRGRPALVVTATSYTSDEDIGLLIDAMKMLDEQFVAEAQDKQTKSSSSSSSSGNNNSNEDDDDDDELKILCLITGKGPLQDMYKDHINSISWLSNRIVIQQIWMEPKDYPSLLATADIGISLHTSTSGMDIPIKILDYYGCELPCAAYDFRGCLRDIVQYNINGITFITKQQLCNEIYDLLIPLKYAEKQQQNTTTTTTAGAADGIGIGGGIGNHNFGNLKRFSLQLQGRLLWNEHWPTNALPVIRKAINKTIVTTTATAEPASFLLTDKEKKDS